MKNRLHRFFAGLVSAVGLMSVTSCFTASDLRFYHPEKPFYEVCDKPLGLPDDVKLWAIDEATGYIFSNANALELRLHASQALAFYRFESTAPESSVESMPAIYGLKCPAQAKAWPNARPILPSSTELLRDTSSAAVWETVGRPDPQWLGVVPQGKPPMKKPPIRVSVCVRPPDVGSNIGEWAYFLTDKKERTLFPREQERSFATRAANADIVFVFNSSASAETAYYFSKDPKKDPKKLCCEGKLPEKSFEEVVGSGELPRLAEVNADSEARTAREAQKAQEEAKNGDGQTSWTSSADGKGAPLDNLEGLVRQLMFASALASGNTSGKSKDPDGSRYGMVGGKNKGGPNLLILQAAVGIVALIGVPLKTPKEFIKAVRDGLQKGEAIIIRDPEFFGKDVAKTLAKEPSQAEVKAAIEAFKKGDEVALESFGKAMAPSLKDAGTIMPYSRAQMFTAGWEGKFQAHHIFEEQMMIDLEKGALAKDAPAIILTEAEHNAFTAKLDAARVKLFDKLEKAERPLEPADLWQMYQEVYKDKPDWLTAIAPYFE